jgi:hypothetical protein
MSEWPEQIPIDGAIPAGREAEDALRFLAQPGIWIHPERHPTNRADDVAVPPDHGTVDRRAGPAQGHTPD